jgi:hydroxymethylglutaryl-CoA lyase
MIKIIECPRDAMQGLKHFIPTDEKLEYLQQLLKVGFETIDIGSFVSPKAIPQMADTHEVIRKLDTSETRSKLLTIVANRRGAEEACRHESIHYLGYPFSVSETFQLRNTNATIEESLGRVAEIQDLAQRHGKEALIYLSMGFGNPYGDVWNVETVSRWVNHLVQMGIKTMSLSDTIGVSTPESIDYLFSNLIPKYPQIEFGAHLHTTPNTWREKIQAAQLAGCKRYDGAIKGYGGCPMAKDDLTGNMPTENLIYFFDELGDNLDLDRKEFNKAMNKATLLFDKYSDMH